MGFLLFFIDGFGIGKASKTNPLYSYGLWKSIIGLKGLITENKIIKKSYCIIPTDAKLGIDGIPQSATGQTTILTGINAPKIIGAHITGYPSTTLTEVINRHSILKNIKEKGFLPTSANAYSREYFKMIEEKNRRVSATTLAIMAAGISFKMLDDIYKGDAVFMDITNHILVTRYPNHRKITTKNAAKNIVNLINTHDFVLYEYFLTDHFGHKGNLKQKKYILRNLNSFLKNIIKSLDLNKHTVIITSDHGNIEDSTTKQHTENKVPTIVFSKNRKILLDFYKNIETIQDVPRLIMNYFV